MRSSRKLPPIVQRIWLWAIPALVAMGAVVIAASDLLNPPMSPGTPSQLGMPGDRPADQVQRPENIDFALEMRGILKSVDREQIVLGTGEQRPDAVIFLLPETIFTVQGRSVSFDELPVGGEVLATFDLDGERRIALNVDANLPGMGPPERQVVAPIVPVVPGARLEGGLPPSAAPEMPSAVEPRKLPEGEE